MSLKDFIKQMLKIEKDNYCTPVEIIDTEPAFHFSLNKGRGGTNE